MTTLVVVRKGGNGTGTITGDVDLGYASYGGRSYSNAIYTNNGGTLTGNLRFGDGSDVFVEMDGQTGVTGTIDGGAGTDTYRRAFTKSGTATLGSLTAVNFEREDVQAIGADTVTTCAARASVRCSSFTSTPASGHVRRHAERCDHGSR